MTLNKFVGIGLHHKIDDLDFLKSTIGEYTPDIITLEVALNCPNFVTFPNFYHWKENESYEYALIAKYAIEQGIPYYCIDGNFNLNQHPFFDNIDAASTLCFPETESTSEGSPFQRMRIVILKEEYIIFLEVILILFLTTILRKLKNFNKKNPIFICQEQIVLQQKA